MKFVYKVSNRLSFEHESNSDKEIFERLSAVVEVYGDPGCGRCDSANVYPKVRKSTAKQGRNKGKTFTYFEITCRECGSFLPVGQNKDSDGIFPTRKDDEGNYDTEHNGWRPPMARRDEEGDA